MKKFCVTAILVALTIVPGRAEILEQILVKVNGEIMTKTDFEERQVTAVRNRNRATQTDLRNDAELRKALDEITPQVLLESIDEMLVMQRGKELGYRMADDQFKSIVENIRKENNLENEEQFNQALTQEGLTMADLRRNLERQMITSRVQQTEVWNKIAVTEAEAQEYYEAHRTDFTTPATLTLREILVQVPEATQGGQAGINVGVEEEAQARAEQLRKRSLSGEDFAKLAASESASASKANGGLIGPIDEQELAPALRQLVAKLKVGEVSQPIRTARGFQLLKLETRTETKILPFEEAREQISDKVFQQKRQGEMEKYLEKLRAQAIIEWKNDDIKKLYDDAVAKKASMKPAAPPA